jgi:hypothetical protein
MKWSNALCASILIEELYMQRDEKHGSSHLRVELEGDEIVVRKPGTTLLLGYRRSVEEARLVLTRSCVKPTSPSPSIGEFRAQALQAAVSKARELGWID